MLKLLRDSILESLRQGKLPDLPDQLSLFHCRQPQHLRNVPLHYPTLVFVLCGEKRLQANGYQATALAGDVLLLPPGHVVLSNIPPPGRRYLALTLTLPTPVNPASHRREQSSHWCLNIPEEVGLLLQQWVEAGTRYPLSDDWHQGRIEEIREQFLQTGQAAHLLQQVPQSRQQVLALIYSDLARAWQLVDVAEHFCCSPSTLQRQLQREGTGFRDLLEEARMVTALAKLQGTRLPVQQVAEQVGYRSPSRFSERFRAHFGLLPNTLRATHRASAVTLTGDNAPFPGDTARA